MTMWEEDNDRRMEVGGRYRRKVVGGSNLEDDNGRMEPREYNRENATGRMTMREWNWENATGRMEGITEACPPPDTGRGRGPQDTSSAVSGTK